MRSLETVLHLIWPTHCSLAIESMIGRIDM